MTRLLSTQRTAMDAPCGAMSRQLSALRSQLSAIRRPSSWQTKTASSSDFSGHGKNEGAAFTPGERRPKSRTPRATEIPKGRSPKGIASCHLWSFVLRPSFGLWLFGPRNFFLLVARGVAATTVPCPSGTARGNAPCRLRASSFPGLKTCGPKAQAIFKRRATPWSSGRAQRSSIFPSSIPLRPNGPILLLARWAERRRGEKRGGGARLLQPGRCPSLGEPAPLRGGTWGRPMPPSVLRAASFLSPSSFVLSQLRRAESS